MARQNIRFYCLMPALTNLIYNVFMPDNKTQIERVAAYLPHAGALVYFIGYIVFNSFLSNYRIYEFKLISFEYLKAGLFFMVVIILPIFFIIRHEIRTPTDNLKENVEELKLLFFRLSIYFVISFMLIFRKPEVTLTLLNLSGIYFILLFISTSFFAKKWPLGIRRGIVLIMPFSLIIYILFSRDLDYISFCFMFITIPAVMLINYIDYGQKKLNPSSIIGLVVVIFYGASMFGLTCYKRLSPYFGGPENRKIVLLFNSNVQRELLVSTLKDSIKGNQTSVLTVVYENEQALYFLLRDSSVLNLNKNLFIGEISYKEK